MRVEYGASKLFENQAEQGWHGWVSADGELTTWTQRCKPGETWAEEAVREWAETTAKAFQMTPGQFDLDTCRKVIGHDYAGQIERLAADDFEAGRYAPPTNDGETYWGNVQGEMKRRVYIAKWHSRERRAERMKK